jgi:hypothetical protein
VYLDIGAAAADTASLAFAFTGTTGSRMWEIKVTQVICASAAA